MVMDILCTFDQLSTKCQKALWCIGVTAQLYFLCHVGFKANHSTKQISLLMDTDFYMIFFVTSKKSHLLITCYVLKFK